MDDNLMNPLLTPDMLPSDKNIEFKQSSFFSRYSALPSPADVRAAAGRAHRHQRDPTFFPHIGLLVKWGCSNSIAEGQCLWALRHILPGMVPVPEVYGWHTDVGPEGYEEVFIYMELIRGVTLEDRWPNLSIEDKLAISIQLRDILARMRRIRQDPNDSYLGMFPPYLQNVIFTTRCVGHVGRQPLLDVIFTKTSITGGPFRSIREFNDFLARMYLMKRDNFDPNAPISDADYRAQLPDDGPITFTHADLHPRNVMLSAEDDGPTRILALIDWHQSGWFPPYWEWCKLAWGVTYEGEWYNEYLPLILTPEDAYVPWCYFTLSMGM